MPSPQLDYAPASRLPWYRRQRLHRRLIALGLLVALSALAWRGPALWRQAHDWLLIRRCLSFHMPTEKLVFDGDPTRARALVAADPDYRSEIDRDHDVNNPVASYAPSLWLSLMSRLDNTSSNFHLAPPLVFMHERTTPQGKRFLVLLRYTGTVSFEGGPTTHLFTVDLIDPTLKLTTNNVRTYQSSMLWITHHFSRLYYAAPDSLDASHFSFRYETEEGAGTIDAWLRNDHELKMECRDGPEKVQ